SSRSSRTRSTATARRQSPARPGRRGRPAGTATRSLRPPAPGWRTSSGPAPSGPARLPRGRSPTCVSAWASARPTNVETMPVASLDLDLEVFQGPFDLLLTLVLREEVDLLELELAEVVLAYVAPLEQTGD